MYKMFTVGLLFLSVSLIQSQAQAKAQAKTCSALFLNPLLKIQQENRLKKISQPIIGRNPQLRLWQQQEAGDREYLATQKTLEVIFLSGTVVSTKSIVSKAENVKMITFENGVEALWKPEGQYNRHNANKEVAAYVLDRRLNLNLVPLTIIRHWNGERGSMQAFISGAQEGG